MTDVFYGILRFRGRLETLLLWIPRLLPLGWKVGDLIGDLLCLSIPTDSK